MAFSRICLRRSSTDEGTGQQEKAGGVEQERGRGRGE